MDTINLPPVSLDISQNELLSMAKLVERALNRSITAFLKSDIELAIDVINSDKAIDLLEVDIDASTFNCLSQDNPSPETMRALVAIQKINYLLERIGDHSVNIAESAESLSRYRNGSNQFDIPNMAENCRKILNDALMSFFNRDINLANNVLTRDDIVDLLNIDISEKIKLRVFEGSLRLEPALEMIRICKNLERVADLASNIAEETIFAATGKIIKHNNV